jgi:TetR/AcrR family transcriptional regulator, transcriptional repressor for nem operon
MRRSKSAAAETRERIVKTAAAQFRRHGIAATGLSELMAAAGLTHGGFYRHFRSKDQLVGEACLTALVAGTEAIAATMGKPPSKGGLEALVNKYLSAKHRDHPENGCALAALGSELGRAKDAAREAATDGYLRLVKVIASQITGLSAREAETRAMAIAASMIGAMTVARFAADRRISDRVLTAAKDYILNGSSSDE